MSKAEDLLNGIQTDTPSLYLARPEADNEPHIVIGPDRFAIVPEELQRLAVQFDHNIETVTFDCPRYWDDHDMSQMIIYINYMRKDGVFGCCLAENIAIDDDDENIMHFTWTVSQNVTLVEGKLRWLVCIKTTDEDGNEKNHWNSELCEDCYVSEGLECVETVLAAYPDIITQLLLRMKLVEDMITEFAFIDDGKGNVDIQGVGISINFAHAYSDEASYAVGDYCVQVGVLHKCNTEIVTPEPFNPNKWTRVYVTDELKKCFQYVADGKVLVASAITDMKVPTDATTTFADMASNIRSIKTGQGNAQPGNVDQGMTFTNSSGELLTGTSTAAADLAVLKVQYGELEDQYDVVVTEKTSLQNAYNTLKTSYDKVSADKASLQSSYNVLQINYNNLNNEKATLQTNYNNLQTSYNALSNEKTTLQNNYNTLQTNYSNLQKDYEKAEASSSEYAAYKQAVVDGLTYSGLGVTTSTSASDVKAKLLAAFPKPQDTTYAFSNGSLASGVTLSNMSISGNEIYSHAGCGEKESNEVTAKVANINLSGFSTLTFRYALTKYVYYGDSSMSYGIDNATTSMNLDGLTTDPNERTYTTATIDVSSLSGTHSLVFLTKVESNSDTYPAEVDIYISEIKLA